MSTLVKRSGFIPTTSFFDDFLTKQLFDWSGWTADSGTVPRVNILETNDEFRVEMAAPGMKKEDFHIELDHDMLTISSEWSESNKEQNEDERYSRREFIYHSFKRSFHLPNTVEADHITASYVDGILYLAIPKKEEAKKKPVRTIAIA